MQTARDGRVAVIYGPPIALIGLAFAALGSLVGGEILALLAGFAGGGVGFYLAWRNEDAIESLFQDTASGWFVGAAVAGIGGGVVRWRCSAGCTRSSGRCRRCCRRRTTR